LKQRYFRVGDELPDDEVVVVRGGALDEDLLRVDATRYFSIYGTYGISVFAARQITVDELAQEPPLVRFEVLTLIRVGNLRASNLRLEPTGRNQRHFTLAWGSLEEGLVLLLMCDHETWHNPYYEG
jgi:hypothetical protein